MNLDIDKERLEFLDFAPAPLPGYWCERQEREFAVWCAAKARAATPQAPAKGTLLVTLDSALAAIEHLNQSNSSGREVGALRMLVDVAPQTPTPAAAEWQAEAARENLALVIARLEQIVATEGEFNENLVDWAKEALPCANALAAPLPRQAAVQGGAIQERMAFNATIDAIFGTTQSAPDQAKSAPATTEKEA